MRVQGFGFHSQGVQGFGFHSPRCSTYRLSTTGCVWGGVGYGVQGLGFERDCFEVEGMYGVCSCFGFWFWVQGCRWRVYGIEFYGVEFRDWSGG